MTLDKQKKQKEPTQEEIKLPLKLLNTKKFNEAKLEVEKQLKIYPQSAILFNILGAINDGEDQLENSVKYYNKSLKINPNYHQAYNNIGTALHKLNKIDEAINSYEKAISLKPDFAEALNNLGSALNEIDRSKESLQYLTKATKINSNYAEAFFNLGVAYDNLNRKEDALDSLHKAIKIKSDYHEAYNSLGLILSDVGKYQDSLSFFKKAIELKPDYEKAYNNLGNLLNNLRKYDEAMTAFHKAIKIKPDYALAHSNHIFNLNYIMDLDADLYLSEVKKFRIDCRPKNKLSFKYGYEKNPKKLRVGFVSADFGNHPGGYHTLSTLRELKKDNFELIAYPTIERKDELSHYFKSLFSEWYLIEKKKDHEVVNQIVEDKIHILMDLQGHSAKNRLPIFMYKAAPIQLSWLSQGTVGIPEIDYLIGSPIITPSDEEKHFVEKIYRLPEITQCFTEPDLDLKVDTLPALKNNFITFGCVNKLAKINDTVVSLWSKILLSVTNSKLLLKNKDFDDENIIEETYLRFAKNNIEKNRLILKGKSKTRKELLNVYNEIDIALDPFPFQGNTSTQESVWMGVPVIVLKGNRYLFHFGESINSNLNMHDWIAKNYDEYVSKAIKFSSDLKKLSKIRMSLREVALKSPVFDASRFAKHFGNMLWEIWNSHEKPQN